MLKDGLLCMVLSQQFSKEIDIQNDADYQNDIEEIYEFLNGTEFVNPDGYYIDGGIFMGQTILALVLAKISGALRLISVKIHLNGSRMH